MSLHPVERSLITGDWDVPTDLEPSPATKLAEDIVACRFRETFDHPATRDVLRVQLTPDQLVAQGLTSALHLSAEATLEDELARLSIAIACLHAFVQVNWTGPDLDVTPLGIIFHGKTIDERLEKQLNQLCISELAYGGEPVYHLVQSAGFLRLAQIILNSPFSHCALISWWRLRLTLIHQHVLDEPSPVPANIKTDVEPLKAKLKDEPELLGRLWLEQGLFDHCFRSDKTAAEEFVQAARATKLQYELSGALGKRTKFQQNDLSQLVLLAESTLSAGGNQAELKADVPAPQLPENIALNDDTLLEKTEFTSSSVSQNTTSHLSHLDPRSQPPLHPLDQCILLSLCLNVRNTSPSHGLTSEQMAPYVDRVISHPLNWSIHTMALLLRSRLESSRTRTVERSTLQLQALVDQMPTADSTASERLKYFHNFELPSKWDLEKELATRFFSLGVVRSAMEIFERLEMWEEVVKCWQSLERPEKAISIVRELLQGTKEEAEHVLSRNKGSVSETRRPMLDATREAKLWCLLGDLEPDSAVEHYERAWTISKETSGRAMRSLGGYYFARTKYKEAIRCLKKAVAINPLLSRSWFILGCAAMREEDWAEAKNAFARCVSIDDEDGESWANLASMYLRMGTTSKKVDADEDAGEADPKSDDAKVPFNNKLLAHRALKQGLRFSYENWRMWSNYMIVSMDVGELAEAARALGRVVEETSEKLGSESIDIDVLERLVDAVTRAPSDEQAATDGRGADNVRNPNEGHGLLRSVLDLLERVILPRISSSPRVFRAYARLLIWQGRWGEAMKAHMDAYRCSTAGTMEKGETDIEKWREGVHEVSEMVDILRNFEGRVEGFNWRLQAKSIIRTFMGRTRDFEDEPEWASLAEIQEELKSGE